MSRQRRRSCRTDDARLDATVPGWGFTVAGADGIRTTYATWFADAGCFEETEARPQPPDSGLPGG